MYSLIYFSDDELRQAQKLRFILLNMDFKWLALLSFVKEVLQVIKSLKHDNIPILSLCLQCEQVCRILPS